jgi:hypothetical protein
MSSRKWATDSELEKYQAFRDPRNLTFWAIESPYYNTPSGGIYVTHEADLLPTFLQVLLIDTDGIYPQDSIFISAPNMLQCRVKILSDCERSATAFYDYQILAIAPYIGEGVVDRRVLQLGRSKLTFERV